MTYDGGPPRAGSDTELEREIDLGVLWLSVRRRLPIILGASLLIGGATYLWSRAQPPVFEGSSSVISAGSQGNDIVGRTLVTAPPLPEGAVVQAIQSPVILTPVIGKLRARTDLPGAAALAAKLQDELSRDEFKSVDVTSTVDGQQNGIVSVRARARTPELAKILTDTLVSQLLLWDAGRAVTGIQKAEASLRAQLAEIDRQLGSAALPALERQTLVNTRATTLQNLAQVTIVRNAATGTLSLVSPAVPPTIPVAPKPLRNGVLAGLLALLLGAAIAALSGALDRTVRTEEDLLGFGIPTLGVIPRLRRRDIVLSGIVRAARQAGLYEAVGFLRINLLSTLQQRPHSRLMISSTAPGEGKSSLSATLADGFAASGQRVLLIDADLRRGTQQEVWAKYDRQSEWRQLAGQGGGRHLQDALRDPANVQVLGVEPNIDLLPAGPGLHDSLGALNRPDLSAVLDAWGAQYDIMLIDSAPLLAIADALVLAPHTSGILLVTEEGKTSLQSVRRVLRRAERAGAQVLGFVINKTEQRRDGAYGMGYEYRARPSASSSEASRPDGGRPGVRV